MRPSSSGQLQLPSAVRTAAPGNSRWPAMIAEYVIRAVDCSAALRADVRQDLIASVSAFASSFTRRQLGEAYDIFV